MTTIQGNPPCPHCRGSLSTPICTKTTACRHCRSFTMPIPSVSFLLKHFSDVTPNMSIERGTNQNPVLSCKLCALVDASRNAMDAEAHSKTADKRRDVERRIANLEKDLITQVATDDDYAALDMQTKLMEILKRKLADLKVEIDRNVEKAWMEYWGVWGKGEYEIIQDGGPVLDRLTY